MMKHIAIAFLLLGNLLAQTPAPAHRDASRPYTGDLSIFEEAGRDQRLKVERVMDLLGISAGKSVADVGAGSGWFTVRAAKRVGSSGRVYAVDINPEAIRYVSNRATKEKLSNITATQSKPDDPLLPSSSIDAVLLLKTYHEVETPVELFTKLRTSLKPDAKVGIIDRNGDAGSHGVQRATVVSEMQQAGYKLDSTHDFVKGDGMDYFMIFTLAPVN